jgi:hypothetical protein
MSAAGLVGLPAERAAALWPDLRPDIDRHERCCVSLLRQAPPPRNPEPQRRGRRAVDLRRGRGGRQG